MPEETPIPQVPKHLHGLLGNLPDVDGSHFAASIWHLADLYGPIFELDFISRKTIVLSGYDAAKEVIEDGKYEKSVSGPLEEVRAIVKDGLFTAYSYEDNWHKAHRILMPVFGPMKIRKMFDGQLDIASQLVLKWSRMGPHDEINVSDDCTRLAFDTIGLCAFSFRFNEFYTKELHPFAVQMGDSLTEASKRGTRTKLETHLRYFSEKKLYQDVGAMHKLCDDLVQDRYDNPDPDNNDLLNTMLNVKDTDTGDKLPRENVRYQMATFLIAGHETTSGTLTFMFYNFMKHPEAYHRAQKEVDDVLGDEVITVNHLPKLKFIDASIKETLRTQGPINMLTRHCIKSELINGKYRCQPDDTLMINLRAMHNDTSVWGEDAKEFKPERWLKPDVPVHAFHPFGFGTRACIGRAFAEQEMLLTTALILQRFQITMADPSYDLRMKATLTVKPDGFKIKVHRRPGKGMMVGIGGQPENAKENGHHRKATANGNKDKKPLTILYGSNAGTCKTYADELAADAEGYGFEAEIKTLDSAVEQMPTDHPVVIITPSYEGKPADNAKKFCAWLSTHADNEEKFKDVKYLLFGVGNSEWAQTYHKVPKTIDLNLKKTGAKSLVEAGFVDVKTDAVGPWDEWCDTVWPVLAGKESASAAPTIKATMQKSNSTSVLGGFENSVITVKENIPLTQAKNGPLKMHMEVELPEGQNYTTGDYLVVLPYNHRENVSRVLRRFKIEADDMIHITESRKEFLKTRNPVSVWDLLSARVELSTPITQRQFDKLAESNSNEKEKKQMTESSQDYEKSILEKRFTILDILEDYPTCKLDFVDYLDMLKPLTPRQYSISSSPLGPNNFGRERMTASISYDVLQVPALCGGERTYYGACSTYLASCKSGTRVHATVRPTNASFHLPSDTQTPVIMIAAGTGIAPMRGFIQERAALKEARKEDLGPALLYFGCRDFEDDYIYREELEHWEKLGVVSLRTCFSRQSPHSKSYRYTSDRIYAEKEELAGLFSEGAKIFICGSASKVGKSTADSCMKIWLERHTDKKEKDAEEWLDTIKEDRYVSDVFG